MALTRIQIVISFADQIGYTKNQAFEMVKTILEINKKALESVENLFISNFGKFHAKEKRAGGSRSRREGPMSAHDNL